MDHNYGLKIKELLEGLDAWRNERKITTKSQESGYARNLFEELGELAEAMKVLANWSKMEIKTYADYVKYEKAFVDSNEPIHFSEVGKDVYKKLDRDLLRKKYGEFGYIDALCDIFVFSGNLVESQRFNEHIVCFHSGILNMGSPEETLIEVLGSKNSKDISMWLTHLYLLLEDLAQIKGFDFYLSMKETLKEINSRTGEWNNDMGKWVKYVTPEAKALWHESNFDNAKS